MYKIINVIRTSQKVINLIQEVKDKRILGWISPAESAYLYMVAKNCIGKGVILEIGCWKGKSTIFLAKGSKAGNNVKIYSVDPHTGSSEHRKLDPNTWTYPEFKSNIQIMNIDDIVVPIIKTSANASINWNKPIELLFIDGAHEYELVKQDFELWYPHVIKDGMVLMHDTDPKTSNPDPLKVCKEYMIESNNFYDLKKIDSLTSGMKK
jgi:predicted O-methyltransferase YrrM